MAAAAPPCWVSPAYKHNVLQHSLAGGSGPPPGPPPSEDAGSNLPYDSMMLMARQLGLLSRWSAAPDAVKRAAQRCASSFGGSIDLLQASVRAGENPDDSCKQLCEYLVPSKMVAHGAADVGGAKRSRPTGGAANGMPRKDR